MKFFNRPKLVLLTVSALGALALGLTFSSVLSFKSTGGSLSPYLVGYVDLDSPGGDGLCAGRACFPGFSNFGSPARSDSQDAIIRLVNPTNIALTAFVHAFDTSSESVGCKKVDNIPPNGYAQVSAVNDLHILNDSNDIVIKVLTVQSSSPSIIQAGVKGYLTHYSAQTFDGGNARFLHMYESELKEVPLEVLKGNSQEEVDLIRLGTC